MACTSVPARDLTFLVTSDTHFGFEKGETANVIQIKVMNNLTGKDYPQQIGGKVARPEFVIICGDLTERGCMPKAWSGKDGFLAYFASDSNSAVKYPTCECRGNHDCNNDNDSNGCKNCIAESITKRHGNVYYSFNKDGVHFVCLDFYPTKEILDWLRTDLRNMPQQDMPVVLYQHIPLKNEPWQNLDSYMEIIRNYNIVALFHGHDHNSEHYIFKDPFSSAEYDFFNTGSPKGNNMLFYVVNITDDKMAVVENDWQDGIGKWRNRFVKNITHKAAETEKKAASADNGNWKFVVYGDSRGDTNIPQRSVNTKILGETVNAVIREKPDFVLFVGDMVFGHPGSPQNFESQMTVWKNTVQPLYDNNIMIYGVRGNHECHEPYNKAIWDKIFSGKYQMPLNGPEGEKNITFSFKHKDAFIVGLDLYIDDSRLNHKWLNEQFAENNQPHVFVFAHEPAFQVVHDSCIGYYPGERDRFWNGLAAEGARVFFAGHDHFYNHARLDDGDGNSGNDLHQFVVGTAGAGMGPWDKTYGGKNGKWAPKLVYHEEQFGYMLVEVNGKDVTATWKHRTGPDRYEAAQDVFKYTVTEPAGAAVIGNTKN